MSPPPRPMALGTPSWPFLPSPPYIPPSEPVSLPSLEPLPDPVPLLSLVPSAPLSETEPLPPGPVPPISVSEPVRPPTEPPSFPLPPGLLPGSSLFFAFSPVECSSLPWSAAIGSIPIGRSKASTFFRSSLLGPNPPPFWSVFFAPVPSVLLAPALPVFLPADPPALSPESTVCFALYFLLVPSPASAAST